MRILPPELQSDKRFTSKPAVAAPVATADAQGGLGLVALHPPKQQQQQQWRHAASGKYDTCSVSSFYAVDREWLMRWRAYHKVQQFHSLSEAEAVKATEARAKAGD